MAFAIPTPPTKDVVGRIEVRLDDETGQQVDVSARVHINVRSNSGQNAGNWNGDLRNQLETRSGQGDTDAQTHLVNLWALLQYIRDKAEQELLG